MRRAHCAVPWSVSMLGSNRTEPIDAIAIDAIAAVDTIALNHERLHLDPDLADSPSLARKIAQRRARQAHSDRLWERGDTDALLLLVVPLLLGL